MWFELLFHPSCPYVSLRVSERGKRRRSRGEGSEDRKGGGEKDVTRRRRTIGIWKGKASGDKM